MPRLHPAVPGHSPRTFIFFCLLVIAALQPARAQNKYPTSGDALISGLTIGQGLTTLADNTALGKSALGLANGGQNTAVGSQALRSNSSSGNTAVGTYALMGNSTGTANTAVGQYALMPNQASSGNTAVGAGAMSGDAMTTISGAQNTALGAASLQYTTGNNNTGLGYRAVRGNISGYSNVGIGTYALYSSTTSSNLVAVGDSALLNNTGVYNTAIGSKTLMSTTSGAYNTALGFQALYSNTTGFGNTASGLYSLYNNSSGYDNTAIGMETMMNNTTGVDNIAIGTYAGTLTGNLTNATVIGYDAWTNSDNSVIIGNSNVTSIGGYVGWSTISDGRFKQNIHQNVPGLAFINKLTPISYTLDIEGIENMCQKVAAGAKGPNGAATRSAADDPVMKQAMKEKSAVIYTGFIAQDVDKAAQSIGYHFSGVDKPRDDQQSLYSLRYSDFVVPLVRAVQELSVKNDSLQQANAQLDTQVTQLGTQVAQLNQRLEQLEQLMGGKTSAVENSTSLTLTSARLFQNVPNPFNQTTQINYYLPANTGTALLQITGMSGETIKSIVLSGTGAGQVSVQTAQLAAGTYIYSLVVDGNMVDTKKMVLVK